MEQLEDNINEVTVTFDQLIQEYKNLSSEDKQKININELKELLALVKKLADDVGSKQELELNKEVLDILKDDATYDDYLEAEFVYINEIKNYIGSFLEEVGDVFYE